MQAVAVGIGYRGCQRGSQLEQVELVFEGAHVNIHRSGHAGIGMGGRDCGLSVSKAGQGHLGLRQVGRHREQRKILVKPALLVVYRSRVVVGCVPLDAVFQLAPVVVAVVYPDVFQQGQLLAHLHYVECVRRQRAADLRRVVHSQGTRGVLAAYLQGQGPVVVNVKRVTVAGAGLVTGVRHFQAQHIGVFQAGDACGHQVIAAAGRANRLAAELCGCVLAACCAYPFDD